MKHKKLQVLIIASFAIISWSACNESGPEPTPEPISAEAQVKQDYHDIYLATATPSIQWNGSTSQCDAGQTDQAVLDKVLLRINYFRGLCDLPPVESFRPEWNIGAQQAALMMERNRRLSHQPSPSWKCYSNEGAYGASRSNLASVSGSEAITGFMWDYGATNINVGHRRWILYPNSKYMGFGCTENYAALWVMDQSGSHDPEQFVAWPPKVVPAPLVWPRWSFSLANADFRNAKVRMYDQDDYTIQINVMARNGKTGLPAIVWEPGTFYDYSHGTLRVEILDVVVNGKNKNFEYEVTIVPVD